MMDSARSRWQLGVLAMGMCLSFVAKESTGSFVGINLCSGVPFSAPPYYDAIGLVKSLGVQSVRLHDADLLRAFAFSDIHLLVDMANDFIPAIASSQAFANDWVRENIVAFLPMVKITGVVVGDEVITKFPSAAADLLPAMHNIYNALVAAELDKQIKVSTSHSSAVLSAGSWPSQAHFNATFFVFLQPILDFLSDTESFFMLSMNPRVWYLPTNDSASLDFALFAPNPGFVDEITNLVYQNVFDAVVDATFNALGAANYPERSLVVVETGWPCTDFLAEKASPESAAIFNSNLIKHILSKKGTPQRPRADLHVYMLDPFSKIKIAGVVPEYQVESSAHKPSSYRELLGFTSNDSGNGTSLSWCIAQLAIPDSQLAVALNWACGPGKANCGPIQSGGPCFIPDTYESHASYAFNSYYQQSGQAPGSCDFGGSAMIVYTDPSYNTCLYPPSTGVGVGQNSTFNPNGSNNNNNNSSGLQLRAESHWLIMLLPLSILAYLRL